MYTVDRPATGEPLIKVTFTKDKIFELDENGQHKSNKERDRILMSVINISGIRNMEIDEQTFADSDDTFQQVSN